MDNPNLHTAHTMIHNGILISLEGIDGSGKSTLAKKLTSRLIADNIDVILTKEPGGTDLGVHLRTLVQTQEIPLCPEAEFLLFAADRAQHFKQLVIPALTAGKMVISDRMADSSLVYQGYGRGLDKAMIQSINTWVTNNIRPNLTIYLRISMEEAQSRLKKRTAKLTAFEKEQQSFTKRLIKGFEELFAKRDDVLQLNGEEPADLLADKAYEYITKTLCDSA